MNEFTHTHTQSISCMADATKLWSLSLRVFCVLCHHLWLWEICAKKMCLLNDDQNYMHVLQSTTHFHYCHRDRDMFFVQTVKVDKYWHIHFTQNWSREVWNGGGSHLIMEETYTLQTVYGENDSHHILYISQNYAWPSHTTFYIVQETDNNCSATKSPQIIKISTGS